MSPLRIAYLGPAGTYAEAAATHVASALPTITELQPYTTIAAVLRAVAATEVNLAVVPVENSVEGGVSMTLDTLWQLDDLQVQQALVLPIRHMLITTATHLQAIKVVYSHPQGLAQCQNWLAVHLTQVEQVSTRSTTAELDRIRQDPHAAVISSERAAHLYQVPILMGPINDHPENSTRFWVVGSTPSTVGTYTSLAFSLPENCPGALLRPLQVLAERHLNMSRIESRPTKKSAGTYVFFIDIEHPDMPHLPLEVLQELTQIAERLRLLGSYSLQTLG
jgi:prephenate dehydratase